MSLFGEDGLEVLDEDTCRHLLAGEHLGRVALSIGALPAIFPVNFVYADGEILFRTAEGAKLTAATAGAVVAFEVDRSDSPDHTGWSVMVVGRSEVVPPDKEHEHPAQGRLAQWASARGDALVRVVPALWTGRRISRNVTAQEPPAFAWAEIELRWTAPVADHSHGRALGSRSPMPASASPLSEAPVEDGPVMPTGEDAVP